MALDLLRKQGIDASSGSLCNMTDDQQANILMQNARANIEIHLREASDWQVSVTDDGFKRQRSYEYVRFAVLECLLLVTVVALAYFLWSN